MEWNKLDSVNSLNTPRLYGGFGTQTSALTTGGGSPNSATELWNGTSWTY
jgi:hypothetical protein